MTEANSEDSKMEIQRTKSYGEKLGSLERQQAAQLGIQEKINAQKEQDSRSDDRRETPPALERGEV